MVGCGSKNKKTNTKPLLLSLQITSLWCCQLCWHDCVSVSAFVALFAGFTDWYYGLELAIMFFFTYFLFSISIYFGVIWRTHAAPQMSVERCYDHRRNLSARKFSHGRLKRLSWNCARMTFDDIIRFSLSLSLSLSAALVAEMMMT